MTVFDTRTDPAATGPTGSPSGTAARFAAVVPSVPIGARVRAVAAAQVADWARSALGAVPGVARVVDRPRRQPLRSGSVALFRWGRAPYGTDDKPASLAAIPWDYVEAEQDDIPFLGLREHWYPLARTAELRRGAPPVPVRLLGDDLAVDRDGSGGARTRRDGRALPVQEHAGVVWVWTGDGGPPAGLLDHQPHARTVLGQPSLLVQRIELPYSHLNQLDNATDLTHVGVLHRSCLLFGDQRPFGEIDARVRPDGGLHAYYKEPGEHPGSFSIDTIDWYLPNVVYHAPDDLGAGLGEGWFWFVPRDVGSFTAWLMVGLAAADGRWQRALLPRLVPALAGSLFDHRLGPGTLVSCLLAGDAPMQASQGRVPRWDLDHLARGDRSVSRARRMVREAHRAEVAARRERGTGRPRLRRP